MQKLCVYVVSSFDCPILFIVMKVKYVVEFAKALEKMPEVYRVDLLIC